MEVSTSVILAGEAREIAKQAEVELAILLGIEQSLRTALRWQPRGMGGGRKLSTVRFAALSFERHLTRTRILADHGGYMHAITDLHPHLASEVRGLSEVRAGLQADFERMFLQLEFVSPEDAPTYNKLYADLEGYLVDLEKFGQKEMGLLQHSFSQDVGGSG